MDYNKLVAGIALFAMFIGIAMFFSFIQKYLIRLFAFKNFHKYYREYNNENLNRREHYLWKVIVIIILMIFALYFLVSANPLFASIFTAGAVLVFFMKKRNYSLNKNTLVFGNEDFDISEIEDIKFKIKTARWFLDTPLNRNVLTIYITSNGTEEKFTFYSILRFSSLIAIVLLIKVLQTNETNITSENLKEIISHCEIKDYNI